MSVRFTTSEIVTMAVEAEKNGFAFYQAMAERATDEKTRKIFAFLAEEEAEHENTFQQLLNKLSPIEMSHTGEAEYCNYLNAFASTRIFNASVNVDQLIQSVTSDIGAVDIAINIEKESILFYYELRERASGEGREGIDEIIREEKDHLTRLAQLKEALVSKP